MELNKKYILVTGGSNGIGRELVNSLISEGVYVGVLDINKSAFIEIEKSSKKVFCFECDITKPSAVEKSVEKFYEMHGAIDVLVNNAGVASGSFFQMTSLQDLKQLFEINFFSQILFTQSISRYMSRFKSGSIINIASISGLRGDTGTTSYGSSKAALMFVTKTIATELGVMNIRVNAIAPSLTMTDMFDQTDEKSRNKLIESSALKRPAEPVEIANVALFLASDLP